MRAARFAAPVAAAGLFAGAFAWAFQQQASTVIASMSCSGGRIQLWIVTALALLVLAAGLALSMFAVRRLREPATNGNGRPRRLLAHIGVMAAAIFLFAILLQIAAFFFLPVCLP